MTETKELILEEEHERLIDEYDELADRMTSLDPMTDLYQELNARGNRLDTHRRGVEWAMDEWDVDALTFKALTLGDDARISDTFGGRGSKPGSERNWQIALGTYEAPYLAHDPEDVRESELEQTVANVAGLDAIAFGRFAVSQIDDLSSVGNLNSERSFARLLTEREATQRRE